MRVSRHQAKLGTRFVRKNMAMKYTDNAAYTALTNTLREFTRSNISPETLAEMLLARNIISEDAYESAIQHHEATQRRRELLYNVMGCGRKRVFQDLVGIILEIPTFEWLGEKLIGMYVYTRSYVRVVYS